MSQIKDLKFNEHTEVSTNTKPFDLEKYLNENWNALIEYSQSVNENIELINKNLDKNTDELKNLQKDNTGNKTAIEAINKKNTEQDTNIQKNAKDIEANQNNIKALQVQNTEVKAENERLRSDIESISLVGEAEGESIDLDDSSGARFKKFGVSGNHSQETREGYNLVKTIGNEANNTQGLTITTNTDGEVVINGTPNTSYAAILVDKDITNILKNGKGYTLWQTKAYSYCYLQIRAVKSDGSGNDYYTLSSNNITNFTVNKTTYSKYVLGVTAGRDVTTHTFDNFKIYFMLLKGIYTNDTIPKYEPYGASPSLDYPSEIETVKDNANVVVCNKNLQKNKWENKTSAGASSNYRSTINIDDMNLKLNKKYVIQFKCNVDYSNSTVFVENSITGESLQISKLLYDNINKINYCVIEITETIKALINKNNCYIVIFNATGMDVNTYSEEMIFEGENKATDYEAHQEQTITMPVQRDMLKEDYFDWENEKQSNLFEKIILDGVNKKCTTSKAVGDGNEFQWAFTIAQATSYIRKVYSNIAKQASDFNQINGIKISVNSNIVYVRSEMKVLNGKGATVENVNELLKNMYDNGNPAIFYIEKASNKELDFTDEQKVVAKKIKETLHTYKNITHIYSTDKTKPVLNVEYAKDLNTQNNNLQNQIDEIKQLISTTQTSAMLLDNLQKEVESEVE